MLVATVCGAGDIVGKTNKRLKAILRIRYGSIQAPRVCFQSEEDLLGTCI